MRNAWAGLCRYAIVGRLSPPSPSLLCFLVFVDNIVCVCASMLLVRRDSVCLEAVVDVVLVSLGVGQLVSSGLCFARSLQFCPF